MVIRPVRAVSRSRAATGRSRLRWCCRDPTPPGLRGSPMLYCASSTASARVMPQAPLFGAQMWTSPCARDRVHSRHGDGTPSTVRDHARNDCPRAIERSVQVHSHRGAPLLRCDIDESAFTAEAGVVRVHYGPSDPSVGEGTSPGSRGTAVATLSTESAGLPSLLVAQCHHGIDP